MTDARASQDPIDVYVAGDVGPSGFGVATRGVVRHLLDADGIRLNLRTHDVGFSRVGVDSGRMFPDTRFREFLLRNDLVNEAYLVEEPREAAKRDTKSLLEKLDTDVDEELMIRQFNGSPDVWMAFGGHGFANEAPDDEDVYTILSTDYNLDVVPDVVADGEAVRTLTKLFQSPMTATDNTHLTEELDVHNQKQLEVWLLETDDDAIADAFDHETEMVRERILDLATGVATESGWRESLGDVDEVWVPSSWVRDAIVDRYPDYASKVFAMPYGVPMNYEPGIYDHANCAFDVHTQRPNPRQHPCLADDTFTFVVISRFYHIKGLYRTIRAYLEAFSGTEDVRLYVKTTSNQQFDFNAEGSINHVVAETGYPEPPEIGVGEEPMDTQHLYDLLGRADCFLQASRAECFGIAQFQAAYCRTPVIYTNWSAQRELIDADNPGFIPLNVFDVERPEPESEAFMFEGPDDYPIDANWATPDVDALAGRMREVYEMPIEERHEAAIAARQYVEDTFDWGDRIGARIERLRRAGA